MASINASSTSANTSSDFAVLAGTPATVFLTSASGALAPNSRADIQIKTSGAVYVTVGQISDANPAAVISGPGTYRVSKQAGDVAFGVDLS
jgi:hypothetical protein